MKKLLILLTLLSSIANASDFCTQGPFVGATNFPRDLSGEVDTRPHTWGTAEAETLTMTFFPPNGYAVRVLSIEGSIDAHVTNLGALTFIPPGSYVGVLGAVANTPPGTGVALHASYLASNTFVYKQGVIPWNSGKTEFAITTPQDFSKVKNSYLIDANNLYFTIASYLNNTGATVHMELTAVVVYEFVRNECIGD